MDAIQNQSFVTFRRALDSRFSDLSQAVQSTLDAFSKDNLEKRVLEATQLQRAARDLKDFLAEADQPPWLQPILNAAEHFVRFKNPEHAKKLLDSLVKHYSKIKPVKFQTDAVPLLDFDALYRRFRDEGRIGELFDELIGIVSKIIDCGEVDSLTALQALQQVLKNLLRVVLGKIPVISEAIEAYDMTIDELDNEFDKVDGNINRATAAAIQREIPHIERLPEYISQTTALLPGPEPESGAGDEDAVDAEFHAVEVEKPDV